ncbi:MAG: hypothetical protein WCL18_05505 [bacterium]
MDAVMEIDRFKLQKLIKEHTLSLEQLGETVQKNDSRTLRG